MSVCSKCHQPIAIDGNIPLLEGDEFIQIICQECSETRFQVYMRLYLSWAEVAYLVLYHLTITTPADKTDEIGRKYYSKKLITQIIEENWSYLCDRTLTAKWKGTLQANLHSEKFIGLSDHDKKKSHWGLKETMLPKIALGIKGRKIAGQLVLNEKTGSFSVKSLISGGDDKQTEDFDASDQVNHAERDITNGTKDNTGQVGIENSIDQFMQSAENDNIDIKMENDSDKEMESDHGIKSEKKRKNPQEDSEFVLSSGKQKVKKVIVRRPKRDYIDPKNCINIYPDLDNIKSPVVMCDFPTHSAPQMKISSGGKTVTTDKGYRMAKSSHGVWEGSWYFEVTIDEHPGHVRIGWSQISGDLQAPCGYDSFSYSFRDSPGTLFHQSKPVEDCPPSYLQGYGIGDVLGVYINLPALTESNRHELLRRLWNPLFDKDYVQIRAKPLLSLKNSEIRYFKNGVDLGTAFSNLYLGKYHAAVSCYMGGKVTFNFGPKFKFPVRIGKPLSQASALVFNPIESLDKMPSDHELERENDSADDRNSAQSDVENSANGIHHEGRI